MPYVVSCSVSELWKVPTGKGVFSSICDTKHITGSWERVCQEKPQVRMERNPSWELVPWPQPRVAGASSSTDGACRRHRHTSCHLPAHPTLDAALMSNCARLVTTLEGSESANIIRDSIPGRKQQVQLLQMSARCEFGCLGMVLSPGHRQDWQAP